MERRADRLHGDVNLAVPISWQLIGYALLAALIAALLFLSFASYARVENVSGAIVLDRGVASIVPTRSGIVTALDAREGQLVQAGARLAEVRAEEAMTGGGTGPRRVMEALEQQDATLIGQSAMMTAAARAERSRLAEQITGLTREIASIDDQIASQRRLVEVAQNEFQSIAGVAERGYISQRDLRAREEALLARRQQLSQLEQSRGAKTSQLAEARQGIAQAGASGQAQVASVASSRAEVAQRRADVEAIRGYTLTSPITGTVTAVTARIGQPVGPQGALMIVVPKDATPRAELYVPTNAAGFLAVGQEVRLAVDAFPYQRFGTVPARISQISSVAIPKAGADGAAVPVYLITAELTQPWVVAFGRRQPLLPGMTLTARIVTEKQSLFRWLFEPLFAVQSR
ncbi:MAG TPA: HlyD family efflux transporter periplasmic adaptor subunit [Allosphingosinicella sp.]